MFLPSEHLTTSLLNPANTGRDTIDTKIAMTANKGAKTFFNISLPCDSIKKTEQLNSKAQRIKNDITITHEHTRIANFPLSLYFVSLIIIFADSIRINPFYTIYDFRQHLQNYYLAFLPLPQDISERAT